MQESALDPMLKQGPTLLIGHHACAMWVPGGADPEHRDVRGPACQVQATSCFARTMSGERSLPRGMDVVCVTRDAGRSHIWLHIRCVKRKKQHRQAEPEPPQLSEQQTSSDMIGICLFVSKRFEISITAGHLCSFYFAGLYLDHSL